jgi:tetratricopeptide (TPR) repeat protein
MRREAQRADAELKGMLTQFPDSPRVHVQIGLLRVLQNNLVEARQSFDRALTLAPDSIEALSGHVALDLAARRPEDARRRVDERLESGSPTVPVLMLAARTYQAGGDAKGAEDMLRRVLALDAGHLPAYNALGQLYFRQGRVDAARVEFEALATREPRPIGALTMLGTIVQGQGDTKAARQYYERVLQLDAEAPVAANNLAWLMATEGGNLDVALQLAQTAKRKLPDNPDVSDTLGYIYYKKDLHPLAIAALKESLEKDANHPVYHSHIGLAYAKAGDAGRAREHLEKALAIKPDFDGAQETKRVLESLR